MSKGDALFVEEEPGAPTLSEAEIVTLALNEQVVARIDAAYAAEPDQPPRSYIGASSVGTKCDAELALSLRGFPNTTPPPKLKRIFRDGHRIERTVVQDLKKAGYAVYEVDETTGRQWRYELAGGHIVCNTDGLIDLEGNEELALLEIKSMNNTLWNRFVKHGVKVSHPKYWDQMQMMGGMGGFKRCLFIAYNKDNSLYHAEIVELDPVEWAYIKDRITTAWRGEARKISNDPESFFCKFCNKVEGCWGRVLPDQLCRTCENSSPTSDGSWWCRLHKHKCAQTCADWAPFKPLEKS